MFLVMVIVAVLGLIAYIITYFLLNYCGDKKPKAKKN
jgi:phage shock protein PspC (stress-responsive transcriptional regulator)